MNQDTSPMRPLRIVSSGLCSSLGYTLPRTVAAIRARLNQFQETRFVGLGGKPVVGAVINGLDLWGGQRQAALLKLAFEEAWCQAEVNDRALFDAATTALLLLLPPAEHRATPLRELHETFQSLVETVGLHGCSRAMHVGRGGLALGFQLASRWMDPRGGAASVGGAKRAADDATAVRHVVLVASDSLLTAPIIDRLLAQRRLVEERHTDALFPGEAAAAVVLSTAPAPGIHPWITGAAHARDEWRLDADVPLRAKGLTEALRSAAAQAGMAVADAEFHASGMNGEHWMAREIELAMSRAMERKREEFPHHRIAQFIGDAGTAGALATVAWIADAIGGSRVPAPRMGRTGLLHFSEDDGQRSAMVLCSVESPSATA